MSKNERLLLLFLSAVLCILICTASYNGLMVAGFYSKETLNWQAQSIGQDTINLFLVVPFLLFSAILIVLKKNYGFPLWAGSVLYLIYTYLIYCFNIHFNNYFIIYCFVLGMCIYLLFYFMPKCVDDLAVKTNERRIEKIIAVYFLIISVSFYCLWLLDIVPAMVNDTVPKSILDGGLVTNPVQVIDLSAFLPGVFITGILLLKNKKLGYILAPVLLSFFILMDLTIALLAIVMVEKGVGSDPAIAIIMGLLALFSLILLVLYFRKIKNGI